MVVVALLALLVLMVAGGLMMWAGVHSWSMTERLHPPTPEQRRKRRQVYAVMVPVLLGSVLLGIVVAGAGAVVIVAAFGAVLLLDAVLWPWLRYRRTKRHSGPS
jgi:predicted MFS family arabinose efflux permease